MATKPWMGSWCKNFVPYSALSDGELYYAEATSATTDPYFELEMRGHTVTETANIYGISRQAVNQTKKRALQKISQVAAASLSMEVS